MNRRSSNRGKAEDGITQRVFRATNEILTIPDLTMNLHIGDILTAEPAHGTEVAAAIKKRLASRKNQEVVLALHLVDSLVKNNMGFHKFVGTTEFMDALTKSLPRSIRDPNARVLMKSKHTQQQKERFTQTLLLIQQWAVVFADSKTLPAFRLAYQAMLRKGVRFPMPADDAPVFMKKPEREQKRGGGGGSAAAPQQHTFNFRDPKCAFGYNSAKLYIDALSATDPRTRWMADPFILELQHTVKACTQDVQQRLQTCSQEALMMELIQCNEVLTDALLYHQALLKGGPRRVSLQQAQEAAKRKEEEKRKKEKEAEEKKKVEEEKKRAEAAKQVVVPKLTGPSPRDSAFPSLEPPSSEPARAKKPKKDKKKKRSSRDGRSSVQYPTSSAAASLSFESVFDQPAPQPQASASSSSTSSAALSFDSIFDHTPTSTSAPEKQEISSNVPVREKKNTSSTRKKERRREKKQLVMDDDDEMQFSGFAPSASQAPVDLFALAPPPGGQLPEPHPPAPKHKKKKSKKKKHKKRGSDTQSPSVVSQPQQQQPSQQQPADLLGDFGFLNLG